MKTILKSVFWMLLIGLMSCHKEDNVKFHLNFIDSKKYYSDEFIPADYMKIYGKWELEKVSGGIFGSGYAPDYDYLEIKSVGIYGLIRNDSLLEYGKIELDTFDLNNSDFLQIKLIPDFYTGQNSYMAPPEKYVDLIGNDSLDLNSPCCDLYNYHYKRIK